jgi:PAS domain S-box-containing protein
MSSLQLIETDQPLEPLIEMTKQLFAQRLDGLFVYDAGLCVREWNPRIEALSGRARDAVVGRTLPELFPHLREPQLMAAGQAALQGRMQTVMGECLVLPDPRSSAHYDTFYVPLMREGVVLGAAAVVRDRVGIQELEERLFESEQRFRTMADCSPVLLWMAGLDGRCEFFNQTWLDFRGRSMEQESGYGWAEGVHPQDFQVCMDTYMDAFRERREFEMVYRLRRHDGVYRWILDHGTPRYASHGEFAGYIGSCTDITDRKDAEDALRQTSDRLVRSNAELERFAYAASHDLQEPLRMVTSYTGLLAEKYLGQLDAEADLFIGFATDGAQRMKDIIDGILSLAKLKQMNPATFGPVDCARALSKAIDTLHLTIAETGAKIEVGPLPALVRGHAASLSQVFQNLLHNAIKFRRAEPCVVRVSAEQNANGWQISISDNGIGMPQQYTERVFVMFQRLHARSEYAGNGIGLALCRQVIELHGGRIWLTSEPDRGTTVSLTLPSV